MHISSRPSAKRPTRSARAPRVSHQASSSALSVEALGEASSCLLESDSTVEVVCVLAVLRSGQEHQGAAAGTSLNLPLRDERLANSAPAVVLVDDNRAKFRGSTIVHDGKADVDACQADNLAV